MKPTRVVRLAAIAAIVPCFPLPLLRAADTPNPSAVTMAGSFQQELGCPGDWQPDCTATHLTFDASDDVWQGTFTVPAGSWEYKAPLNNSWDENYGAHAQRNGANIPLAVGAETAVKFFYAHETHWVTDNVNSLIATAPGSFQSELGCPGDWQPDCLRSWLQDPDGDGLFSFTTRSLPAGSYEVKVAIDESWAENYGAGGVQNGPNIPFTVATDCAETVFTYDSATHVLTVTAGVGPSQPASVTIPGSFQSELGCSEDWQPACAVTHLTFDPTDGVWQETFSIPAGSWEYKAALNDSWDENYGANAQRNGANIALSLAASQAVKLYYDHQTHWVADNRTKVIATAPGSFQSELGCPGDWQPDCLQSWLQDPDGDGLYTFSSRSLPAGNYEVKVAIDESWAENYGAGGVRDGANIAFSVPAACAEIFFAYDAATHVLTVSATGAPHGNLGRAQAYWVSEDTIAWDPGPVAPDWTVALHADPDGALTLDASGVQGGTSYPLTRDPAGLPQAVRDKFPHLAGHHAWKLAADDLADVADLLEGQVAVSAKDGTGQLMDATSLQIQGVLDDLYTYDGPLGATFASGKIPTLRVWAPTARAVRLHLFADGVSPMPATLPTVVPMNEDPASGVWSVTGTADWYGRYYLYEVEVYVRGTGVVTNLVTDPYSVALAKNSRRSQILSLADPTTKPYGWDFTKKPRLGGFEDVVLYELHLRDFSASDPTVPEPLKGTFKAFTLADSKGMRHLRSLARAGLTHVHLLPVFDIATIDEEKANWQTPQGDLASFPPDSEEQQARVSAVADSDGFNWGYDPWHYTVPEGSYAVDPEGASRVREFRDMVKALNGAGLRVVMDVVYNHTNAAGQNDKSVLDRIVPGYYHRLNGDGNVETSTCCQNTASEFNMMEKLLIDSVLTWARDYKVDGFRFDLMGHHMKRNMEKLRAALDALTPAVDGVDGGKVFLYGEGWNFGEVANNARGVQATQLNMAGTGIATFSDRLRDGVRGGGPFSGLQEQGFINGLSYDPNATNQGSPQDQLNRLLLLSDWIRVGLAGNLAAYPLEDRFGNQVLGSQIDYNGQPAGYTQDPQEVISYIEAHDNETLFDANQAKAPLGTGMADRVRIQNLGMSLVGLGQGVPFFHAGVELLRSKSMDRNSYNSGDWFNKLDFTRTTNNWGVGLPPARDNQSNWPLDRVLLANPALKPAAADIEAAYLHFQEILAVRKSSKLLRLPTGQEVIDRVRFHNTGPGQIPGLIAWSVTDATGAIDRHRRLVVVVVNAADEARSLTVGTLAGEPLVLHRLQARSADPVVRTAAFDASTGTFSVPARTAAVFWAFRPLTDQIGFVIADVQALVDQGVLHPGPGAALLAVLRGARRSAEAGHTKAAAVQLGVALLQVRLFLSSEQGEPLSEQIEEILAQLR